MLQPHCGAPPHLSFHPVATAVNCSRGSGHGRRRRRPKPKPIAFPPPPLHRLFSSSLRRLLPRPRPPTVLLPGGGGWFRRRRKIQAEEALALALSLALGGDRLAGLAEAWNASRLGQALGVWAAVWGRGRGRRGGGLRRLVAFLLGVAFCALVCHFRGAAVLEGLRKTGGGRKLVRVLLR